MSETQGIIAGVAGRYAKALFDLSLETGATEVVRKDRLALKDALATNADLVRALKDPSISRESMVGVMAQLTKALQLQPLTAKFLGLMAQKRRLPFLERALDGFEALVAEQRGEATAKVVSAAPLTDAQAEELSAGLSKMAGGRKVHMQREVDPELIGGLVVQMGSKMIDASIRSKLARLQQSMKEVGR
ncbi:MAG: F0F1 ATP synthase subunit delta [Pseudomonadota bacterium]